MNKITNQRSKLFAFVCMYISNQNEVEKRTKERINSDNKKKRIRTTTITTSSTSTIFFIAYILIQRSRENESERRVSSVIHSYFDSLASSQMILSDSPLLHQY